jgi:hypothetical protein
MMKQAALAIALVLFDGTAQAETMLSSRSRSEESMVSSHPRSDLCSKCDSGDTGGTCKNDTDWCEWYSVNDFRSVIPGASQNLHFVRRCDSTSWHLFNTACRKYIQLIGDHRGRLSTLNCKCRCDGVECRVTEEPAVFEADVSDAIAVDPSIDPQLALQIAEAYRLNRIIGLEKQDQTAARVRMRLESISKESIDFVVELFDGACVLKLRVRLEREKNERPSLRVIKKLESGCS